MIPYLQMLAHILAHGIRKPNRTGIDTLAVFGYQMRIDLAKGFPLLTTKKMFTKAVVAELLWFLSGSTNNNDLTAQGVNIWTPWADPRDGELGPIYSKQWRRWEGINRRRSEPNVTWPVVVDQISNLVRDIKATAADPTVSVGRRLIVTAWNPAEIPQMQLAPCHALTQFDVTDGKLSCQLYQRSADSFLGVPFNIASYALLTHMIAQVCGLQIGEFIHTFGDLHIYENHLPQVKEQLTREPLPLCRLVLDPTIMDIDTFKAEHITFADYQSHLAIKAEVAV